MAEKNIQDIPTNATPASTAEVFSKSASDTLQWVDPATLPAVADAQTDATQGIADAAAAQTAADAAQTDATQALADAAAAQTDATQALADASTAQSAAEGAAIAAANAQTDADAAQTTADSKVSKSGDTMTGNLMIESGTPLITLHDTAGTPDQRRVQVFANASNFIVRHVTDAGAVLRTWIMATHATGLLDLSGATSVKVPDADADGEALAHSQGGWQLGSGTLTGQLDMSPAAAAPTLNLNDAGSYGSTVNFKRGGFPRWALIASTDGDTFYLRRFDSSGVAIDNQLIISNDNISMAQAGSVTVPAISGASQAAQVTAYNASTGQLQIGGHEVGDTGWRDVTPLGSWAADKLRIRRIGSMVTISVFGLDGSSASNNLVYSIPAGFRSTLSSDLSYTSTICDGSIANPTTLYISHTAGINYNLLADRTVATSHRGSITFPATDTWPATLPGTAA